MDDAGRQIETTSLQLPEVQNVTARAVTRLINGGQATFIFTDMYNAEWTTRPVTLPHATTLSNAKAKMQTSVFAGWHPLKVDPTSAFSDMVRSTWGVVAASNIADGVAPSTITAAAGHLAGIAAGDVMVLKQYGKTSASGFDNNQVTTLYRATAKT